MSLLVISLLALVVGPILYRAADALRQALLLLDGFVMIAVCGLVVVHIVPHTVAVAGLGAVFVALAGFLGPGLIEKNLHRAAQRTHVATLVLACVGLVVHAFLDGIALGAPAVGHDHGHDQASVLALAVVLHRVPVAVTIWWLLRPGAGLIAASATLAALAAATVCGFALSGSFEAALDSDLLALFQALVAGSLLHVVVHRPHPVSAPPAGGSGNVFAGVGAVLGLVLVAVLSDIHMPAQRTLGEGGFGATFMTLALESAPALLLAFALAGLIQVYLPQASMRWMRTGRPWTEATRGVVFGLPLPICSCGVIPLYRSLISRGVPATAAMAFLIATPELGLDAVLISLPLLGAELTVARVVASAAVALVVGALVGSLADALHRHHEPDPSPARVRGNFWQRVRLGLHFGFGEIVDHVGPWLLLGVVIASLVEPMIGGEWLTRLPWGADVAIFALLGMPVYVCASGATPLIAVLIHKGISPGAALAFLLAGPATNVTTFGVLARLHDRRIALCFASVIAGMAIALGLGLNLLIHDVDAIELHSAANDDPNLLSMVCLAGLTLVFVLSLLRQGPRGFVAQVISPHDDDDGGHDHDHGDHDHDRGGGSGPPACSNSGCC